MIRMKLVICLQDHRMDFNYFFLVNWLTGVLFIHLVQWVLKMTKVYFDGFTAWFLIVVHAVLLQMVRMKFICLLDHRMDLFFGLYIFFF